MKKPTKTPAAPRYPLSVEWSDEDQVWIGRCPEVMMGGIHGDDSAAVFSELQQVANEVLQIIRKRDQPLPAMFAKKKFSGRFVLRTTPDLPRALALRALQDNRSLNDYLVQTLSVAK